MPSPSTTPVTTMVDVAPDELSSPTCPLCQTTHPSLTGDAVHESAYDGQRPIDLWLDDDRPAPAGWVGVTTIVDAMLHLETGRVDRASLDHDLGACETCMDGMGVEEWLEAHKFRTMPHCHHVGTGYDLCVWMAVTGHWPKEEPTVHSANRVGRRRMKGVIAKHFPLSPTTRSCRTRATRSWFASLTGRYSLSFPKPHD